MRIANHPLLSRTAHALVLSAATSLALLLMLVAGSDTVLQAQTADTPTPVVTTVPDDDSGVQNRQPTEGKLNPPKYPNMDSNLNRIVQQVESGQTTANAAAASAPLHSEESVAVTIYITEGYADAIVEFLEANGASPRNVGTDYIEAYVPVSLLPEASTQEGVISIRTIVPPQPAQVTVVSQAASVHGATAWHDAGYKGQGVKIGIIDTGFEGFAALQGTELPSTVEAWCYTDVGVHTFSLSDCEIEEDEHGTAVTEAAFDIAPEATYYIARPITQGDLVDAVDWMVEHDVDVINMSVSRIWTGPGDGTSPFSNSPLKTVDSAVDGGIVWLNSAGNSAMDTWYGPFADTDADGIHEFSGEYNCSNVWLEAGETFSVQLRWDDNWLNPAPTSDLGLVLLHFDRQDEFVDVATSEDEQTETLIPFEFIKYTALLSGYYCMSVLLYSGDEPDWIQLQSFTGQDIEYPTLHHSIVEPADSANDGLLAVGAAPASDTSTIEDFSSRGPTLDNRTKPEIVGADSVHSAAYGGAFYGTSQASPHVAGLAALVKQRFPEYSPQQIATYLKNHAEERGDTGADNTWGDGFARLPASGAATPTPEPTASATPIADSCVELLGADGAVNGSWATDCESSHPDRGGHYAGFYTFSLAEAAEITITLESSEDTYLYLREGMGRDGTVLCENDDYATEVASTLCGIIDSSIDASTDSGIVASLGEGSYTIEATTYDAGATGDFVLTISGLPATPEPTVTPEPTTTPEPTVTPEPTATPPADSCIDTVNADGATDGSWSSDCESSHPDRSGRYSRFYSFSLTESADVTITLESSTDPYLYLRGGAGRDGTVLCENDDYASEITSTLCGIIGSSLDTNTDSGIVASLVEGAYTIEATTYDAGATGAFVLTVSGLASTTGPQPTPTPEPSPTPTPTPTPSPPLDTPAVVVSAGPNHACALDSNGEIICEGADDSDQESGRPTDSGYIALSVGGKHSCAIDSNGNVECWGSDDSAGQVSNHPASNGFVAVSVGDKHSCAIDADSVVQCWGSNEYGQSNAPSRGTFVAIGSGDNYTCGLRSDNDLECWGRFEAVTGATPTPDDTPDLAVDGPTVSNSSLSAGASFTLSVTVRNQGSGGSGSTTVRYYQSTDAIITSSDTLVGTESIEGLRPSASTDQSINLTAPPTAGTYYYGACVDMNSDETGTVNICSSAVAVTVGTVTAGDYDADNDGLIEISNLSQLNAVRWDLDGDGESRDSGYAQAFPGAVPSMGCPDAGCTGYELTGDLDFDTNGNGQADAGDTYWNEGDGWEPIKPISGFDFEATFDGAGHTIANLYINRSAASSVGLFGSTDSDSVIKNIGLVSASVKGNNKVGSLVGEHRGRIDNSYATGTVDGNEEVGGLVGSVWGSTIANSNSASSVAGLGNEVGGLVGGSFSSGLIIDSHATGSVTGNGDVGGLIGSSWSVTIRNSYATGSVTGTSGNVGGLVGNTFSSVTVADSYATGPVTGTNQVGGMVGSGRSANISNCYATGNVTGTGEVGGLIGSAGGAITGSYATGTVTATGDEVGGLAGGISGASITGSYANGTVTTAGNEVGGLVGGSFSSGTITASYATGNVSGNREVAGLLGSSWGVTVRNSYTVGSVSGTDDVGGLVGDEFGSGNNVISSYWDTQTTGQPSSVGGIGQSSSQLQSPISNVGIYADWNADWWDFGTSSQYPVLKYGGLSVTDQRN